MRKTEQIRLLLNDISRIEPIRGRQDYLPLTRRIERGRMLLSLEEGSFELTFSRVQSTLQKTLTDFNEQCNSQGKQTLVPEDLVNQVDEFIDQPQILIPSALVYSLDHQTTKNNGEANEQFRHLGWQCVYLLALFPRALRSDALVCQPGDDVFNHFGIVAREHRESRSRLIEGTLRYLIRIATSYTGRGLPYLELVQEGYFGLKHAVDRFVEREGAHFQQYAGQWIQQRMMRAIADKGRLIRVPTHLNEKIAQLKRLEQEYENDLVLRPRARDQEIIERLGLSIENEVDNKQGNAAAKLKRLREADARHYSLDLAPFADILVDEAGSEEQAMQRLLHETLEEWLQSLPEREREIMRMRTGLVDGEERTLEEIGQFFGLSRERIRQLETGVLRRAGNQHWKSALLGASPEADHRVETAINELRRPLIGVLEDLDMREALQPDTIRKERLWIERLVEKRIMRGKRRLAGKRGQPTRISIFMQVLSEAGQPLHYSEIHQRALVLLPQQSHMTKELTYAALFYSDRFRLLGGGIFSLATWQISTEQTADGPALVHCPPPLLPANAHPRAFLESILVARKLVQTQPEITLMKFFEEMLKDARRDRTNPQDAFDAWYVAGLHGHIHYSRQMRETIHLSIPAEWTLAEVRIHCLNHVCKRLVKTPELLYALDQMASADVPTLQKMLFGSESAGFDLPLRLNMLAAFEAVRADGGRWRITDVGRKALQANPPQELPDLSLADAVEPETEERDDNWDDDLDMFLL